MGLSLLEKMLSDKCTLPKHLVHGILVFFFFSIPHVFWCMNLIDLSLVLLLCSHKVLSK